VYGAGSAFAVQVTSGITGAQQMTIDFKNNNLNGRSKWRAAEFRDYVTCRTRVCVTVGMMTTGYDCEDLLNVVLARPIFSPTDFIQIKGRGTRLYQFSHISGSGAVTAKKEAFALFDFFANCEYFEKDFDYDKKIDLAKEGKKKRNPDPVPYIADDFTNTSPDPLKQLVRDDIGVEGMKIDREMFRQRFEEQARDAHDVDITLREAIENGNWPEAEQRVKDLVLDRPKEFWNLDKLQTIYRTDRNPTLREILRHVFGLLPAIPTRAQLADEAFERFLSTETTNATHTRELREVFQAFILDAHTRELVESGKFAELRAIDAGLFQALQTLTPEERKLALRYIEREVRVGEVEG
jgi:type I restriction enzyme R subunit